MASKVIPINSDAELMDQKDEGEQVGPSMERQMKDRRHSRGAAVMKTKLSDTHNTAENTTKDKLRAFRKPNKVQDWLQTTPAQGCQTLSWKAAHLMVDRRTRIFFGVCIMVNAVIIGVEADHGDHSPEVWQAIELCFVLIFSMELALNLLAFGRLYWERYENCFDAFVVVASVIDFSVSSALSGHQGSALSVIRLFRIVRLMRLITFLDQLSFLVETFVKGMKDVGWAIVLWMLCLYTFAVVAKTLFGKSSRLREELQGQVDIDKYFGTVPSCIVTFIAFFTYDDAISKQRAIGEIYPWAWVIFFTFMVIVSIGIMELMTAIFIDSMMEAKSKRENRSVLERVARRHQVTELINGLFDAFDDDSNRKLDQEELSECLKVFNDPEMQELLEFVNIDSKRVQEAINLADIDGDDGVTKVEFSEALESMHLEVRKSDIRHVLQKIAIAGRKSQENHTRLAEQVDSIERSQKASAL